MVRVAQHAIEFTGFSTHYALSFFFQAFLFHSRFTNHLFSIKSAFDPACT